MRTPSMNLIGEVEQKFHYCRVSVLLFLSVSLIRYINLHEWMNIQEQRIEIIIPSKLVIRSKISTTEETRYKKVVEQERAKLQIETIKTGVRNRKDKYKDEEKQQFENKTDTVAKNTNIVKVEENESFLWRGAQSRLCKHIKKEKRRFVASTKSEYLHLVLVIPCREFHEQHQHGNFMLGYYAMKLAAIAFQAEFTFRCEEEEGKNYLLWWLQSKELGERISSSTLSTSARMSQIGNYQFSFNHSLYDPPYPTPNIACQGMGRVALHYTSDYARKDLRNMANELSPTLHNKGMKIDEVAIHLRCGDILNKNMSQKDKNYGLIQFQAYRKRIPLTVESIGIITAPFEEKNRRKQDHGSGLLCQTLVYRLVDYLRTHFPNTIVNIRNDPSESIPEVVSRLILAKHNFCVRSTFCLFPSIASYGTSYVQKGGVAYFFDEISNVYDDIYLMDEPFLFTNEIRDKGFNSTLQWLTES